MKKTAILLLICTLLLTFAGCDQSNDDNSGSTNDGNGSENGGNLEKPKDYLVEGEDYLDIASSYNGEAMNYNEALWYVNMLDKLPLPDPYVFVEGNTYYIVGTSDRNPDVVDCYVTTDFVTYEPHYGIYDPTLYDGWEDREEALIFAPEIYNFDGLYYMYYSAKDDTLRRRCSVVVADNPLGPYRPIVNDEVDGLNNPLFHNAEYLKRGLDATVFTDDDGKRYIYFTVTADTQHIVGMELISPYEADWSTYRELLKPGRVDSDSDEILLEWEMYRDNKIQINEAPFMIKSGGKYYLTYSTNGCWNKYYNVCYAVSDSPLGNFEKPYEEGKIWTNLLLGFPGTNDEEEPVYDQWEGFASGTGHHCFFYVGEELMIGYHAHQNRGWNSKYYTPRYFAIDYVHFDENGTPFCNGPTYSVINLPESISGMKNITEGATVRGENVQNVEKVVDNYVVDCYNLDAKENEVILGEGKSEIEITFDSTYDIKGIVVYNSAYFDEYIVEIEYLDFGNGNIIYYPQFCEDFYVNADEDFVRPCSTIVLEILKSFEADHVKIGFDLPEGGSINEVVILGQ